MDVRLSSVPVHHSPENTAVVASSARHPLLDSLADLVHDREDGPPRRGRQSDEVVALVGFREPATELHAGTPGVRGNLRNAVEYLLDLPDPPVRFGERRAGRRPVVEHEPALVHRS